jgi:glucose-1-phosphate cytidylyltransferase
MKVVFLAGGLGTRISEETHLKPKPMIEIGGKPILWHLMKYYSFYGFNDFVVCLGYKGYVVKEYFNNYFMHMSDMHFNLENNSIDFLQSNAEPWKITLVDTGEFTMTGGRIAKIKQHVVQDDNFCLTYGDGLSNIDIKKLVNFHKQHKKIATLSAVTPPGRFGALSMKGDSVEKFCEKPKGDGNYINGGFFVLSNKVFDYLDYDHELLIWEEEPLKNLAKNGELKAFKHDNFWQPMDTLRDKNKLEKLWSENLAPWKVWG